MSYATNLTAIDSLNVICAENTSRRHYILSTYLSKHPDDVQFFTGGRRSVCTDTDALARLHAYATTDMAKYFERTAKSSVQKIKETAPADLDLTDAAYIHELERQIAALRARGFDIKCTITYKQNVTL